MKLEESLKQHKRKLRPKKISSSSSKSTARQKCPNESKWKESSSHKSRQKIKSLSKSESKFSLIKMIKPRL